MELVSITGFEKVKTLSHGDIDGGYGASFAPPFGPGFIPFPSETADGLPFHRQITAGSASRLEGHGAARLDRRRLLLQREHHDRQLRLQHAGRQRAGRLRAARSSSTSATAVFGSVGYQVNDQFKIKGGLRFSHDDKYWTATRTLSPIGAGADRPAVRKPEHLAPDRRSVRRLVPPARTPTSTRASRPATARRASRAACCSATRHRSRRPKRSRPAKSA